SREGTAKVAGAVTSSVACPMVANPLNCKDEVSTSCLAASLHDCQAKVAMTPIQNATRKRDMARRSRSSATRLGPALFGSSAGGMVASTKGLIGNQTTEYSDRPRSSTEPIGTPPSS